MAIKIRDILQKRLYVTAKKYEAKYDETILAPEDLMGRENLWRAAVCYGLRQLVS